MTIKEALAGAALAALPVAVLAGPALTGLEEAAGADAVSAISAPEIGAVKDARSGGVAGPEKGPGADAPATKVHALAQRMAKVGDVGGPTSLDYAKIEVGWAGAAEIKGYDVKGAEADLAGYLMAIMEVAASREGGAWDQIKAIAQGALRTGGYPALLKAGSELRLLTADIRADRGAGEGTAIKRLPVGWFERDEPEEGWHLDRSRVNWKCKSLGCDPDNGACYLNDSETRCRNG